MDLCRPHLIAKTKQFIFQRKHIGTHIAFDEGDLGLTQSECLRAVNRVEALETAAINSKTTLNRLV